jgi:hypothetical protein
MEWALGWLKTPAHKILSNFDLTFGGRLGLYGVDAKAPAFGLAR